MCGDVHIPYPFGIGDDCSWPAGSDDDFTIICNHRFSPPRPYTGDFEVVGISLEAGEVRVVAPVAYICYNSSTTAVSGGIVGWTLRFVSPFLVAQTRNTFTAIGCHTLAYLTGRDDRSYLTGCITSCESLHDAARDGEECTGLGCCQTSIPTNISTIEVFWRNSLNYTPQNPAWRYSPCSYAFVSEKGW